MSTTSVEGDDGDIPDEPLRGLQASDGDT